MERMVMQVTGGRLVLEELVDGRRLFLKLTVHEVTVSTELNRMQRATIKALL